MPGKAFEAGRLLLGYLVLIVLMLPLAFCCAILRWCVLEKLAWYVLLLCDYLVPLELAIEYDNATDVSC
jgi:hypothetical protein